jgi:hypothetical protein
MSKSIEKSNSSCHSKVTFKELEKLVECSMIMFSPSQEIRNLKPKAQELKMKTQTRLGVFERSSGKKTNCHVLGRSCFFERTFEKMQMIFIFCIFFERTSEKFRVIFILVGCGVVLKEP